MFNLPVTFKEENENYLTLISLKNFAKSKNLRTNALRDELIDNILEYANYNTSNEEEVQHWIDSATKEGIKDVYLKKIDIDHSTTQILKNEPLLEAKLSNYFQNINRRHLCANHYDENLKLVKYEVNQTLNGIVTSFYLCKMIYTEDSKNAARTYMYPINVDIYVDKQYVTGRAKPKSNMYEYSSNGLNVDINTQLSADREIIKAIAFILNIFSLYSKRATEVFDIFRGQLYKMLDNYTHTPLEIQEMIDDKQIEIQQISKIIRETICTVPIKYKEDIDSDVNNLVEKYISISYPDKNIFTRNRIAYPLSIDATDEEESRVEQTAGLEEPLQSKAIFFDNKKMMQKSKLCDSVKFCYTRLNTLYSGKSFNVKISVKKDYCLFKFTEYTLEEDINNVLFSIIDA